MELIDNINRLLGDDLEGAGFTEVNHPRCAWFMRRGCRFGGMDN